MSKPLTHHQAVRSVITEARQLTVLVRKRVNPLLAEMGLTIASLAVLETLAEGGTATVPELARSLLMSRQATQRFVDELVAAGRVERRANSRHARSDLYVLTESGGHSLEQAARLEARLFSALPLTDSAEDLQDAAAAVARVRDAVSRAAP